MLCLIGRFLDINSLNPTFLMSSLIERFGRLYILSNSCTNFSHRLKHGGVVSFWTGNQNVGADFMVFLIILIVSIVFMNIHFVSGRSWGVIFSIGHKRVIYASLKYFKVSLGYPVFSVHHQPRTVGNAL